MSNVAKKKTEAEKTDAETLELVREYNEIATMALDEIADDLDVVELALQACNNPDHAKIAGAVHRIARRARAASEEAS